MSENTQPKSDRQLAAASYIGPLFLVPILMKHKNPFVMHHARQGLVLFLVWFGLWILNVIPILGSIAWVLGTVVIIIGMIIGIINALQGVSWEMPVLGGYAKKLNV